MILTEYFEHPLVIKLAKVYKSVVDKYEQENFNYVGINFDEKGIYSVKFYFHIFPVIKEEDVKLFLGDNYRDYFKYTHLYADSIKQGCAFELKFLRDKEKPTIGFHYRLEADEKSFQLIGYPKKINFIDSNLEPGINYEYNEDEVHIKNYYYYEKDSHKEYFANRFKMDFLAEVPFIEFAESIDMSKINFWFGNENYHKIKKIDLFSNTELQHIESVENQYKLDLKACGVYENKHIKSTYFFRNMVTTDKISTDEYLII